MRQIDQAGPDGPIGGGGTIGGGSVGSIGGVGLGSWTFTAVVQM